MKFNSTLILVILILLLLGGGFIGYNYMNNKVEDARIDLRKERIKNDTLQILADGQARKLVADTLTKKQLRKKVDSLQIAYDGKPVTITQIVVTPKDSKKEIDSIIIGNEEIKVVDFYPQKDNYFVKYSNTINTLTKEGNSNWKFGKINLDLLITQKKDGTYEANMKAPAFIAINSLDVQSQPIDPIVSDNFGVLLGAGYGRDFGLGTDYLRVDGGIRFKKTYLMIGGNTNKQADIGLKYEF